MYILKKTLKIDCAHHLKDSDCLTTKKCLNLHGHSYKIEIEIKKGLLIEGMVIDFGRIKSIVNELDHQNLNDFMENPTAEVMSKYLHDKISSELIKDSKDDDFELSVTVWETNDSSVTYI